MPQNTIITDEAITPTIMNERTWGWDTAFPATWAVNGWFWRTDLNNLYQNTGTEASPIWTLRTGLTDHLHSGAGDGGKLDNTTIITVSSTDFKLAELALM